MNHLDIFFLVLIGISVLYSLIRGLVREIFSFLAVICGFLGASYGYVFVAKWLESLLDSEFLALILGFLILLIAIAMLVGLLGRLLSGLVKKVRLTWADRTAGAAFGFLKAVLLIAILCLVLTAFLPAKSRLISDSVIAPPALSIAGGLAVMAPEKLHRLYAEKEKDLRKYWASREPSGRKSEPTGRKK